MWKLVAEAAEVAEILAEYGIAPHEYSPVVNALRKNPQAWLDFMMKYVSYQFYMPSFLLTVMMYFTRNVYS